MTWTTEQKIAYLLRQPWTIFAETTPEGDRLLRIKELPSAVASGEDDDALIADFWESLTVTLEAYFAVGTNPPLPANAQSYPWERSMPVATVAQAISIRQGVQRVYSGFTAGSFQLPVAAVNDQKLDLCAVA